MADPPGVEPEFQPSEDCALSIGRRTGKMVLAEGFEPPSLFVRSEVSCPVERREQTKTNKWHREEATIPNLPSQSRTVCRLSYPVIWQGDPGLNREPVESKSTALPVELSPCVWGDRRESNSRGLIHNQPICH
jgi:hypothetical protein